METYGITLDEYDAMWKEQGECCAICHRQPRYNCDVDHDHAVERALVGIGVAPTVARRRSIRGLLCKLCNRRLLPSVRDDRMTLIEAIAYLDAPPALNVLGPIQPPT